MDLTNSDSWHLVQQVLDYKNTSADGVFHAPLQPLTFTVSSPVLSVKITSQYFKPTWFTGGWASLWGNLFGEEERLALSHRCKLNAKDLVQFDDFGIVPYKLILDFPRWIPSVDVILWEYLDQSGRYLTNPVEKALDDLNAKIVGENIVFSSVNYQELIDGTDTLQQSIFTATTKYANYEVGRFYRTDTGQTLSDPVIVPLPNQIRAIFTGVEQIPPNVVTVTLKPK